MRVVADANVLVSAALARSPEAPSVMILDAALEDEIELVTSPALLVEVADVLARPRLQKYVTLEEADEFVAELMKETTFVVDPVDLERVCRDPDDDYLVALARATRADVLVTGDDDLLSLDADNLGVDVITPRKLADRLS